MKKTMKRICRGIALSGRHHLALLLVVCLLLGLTLSGMAQETGSGAGEAGSSAALSASGENGGTEAAEEEKDEKKSAKAEEKKEEKESAKAEGKEEKKSDKTDGKTEEKSGEAEEKAEEKSGKAEEEKEEKQESEKQETEASEKEGAPEAEETPEASEETEESLAAAADGDTEPSGEGGSGDGSTGGSNANAAEDEEETLTLTVTLEWENGAPDLSQAGGYLEVALFDVDAYEEAFDSYAATYLADADESSIADLKHYWPYEMGGYIKGKTVQVSASSSWTGTVTITRADVTDWIDDDETLADYALEYLVWKEEELLEGYTWKKQASSDSEDGKTISTIITNGAAEGTTSQTLQIVWDDENDAEGLRPKSVTAALNHGESAALDEAGGWTVTLEDLPAYENGARYDYAWVETAISNYALEHVLYDGTLTVFTYKCLVTTVYEEVEIPQAHYKLTIRYYAGDEKLFDNFVGIYAAGETYNVKSPVKAGYSMDKPRVQGTITKNTKITVRYTPQEYTLTVRFRGTDNTDLATAYTGKFATGSTYQVAVPAVSGYTPQMRTVTGTMPGRNNEIVVYYTKASGQPDEVELQDYETPLGLGMVSVNAGDCLE